MHDHLDDRRYTATLVRLLGRRSHRRAGSRPRRSSGSRACPSAAADGSRCASRRAARAGRESTSGRRAPARARGTRHTSARSRTTSPREDVRAVRESSASVSFARTSSRLALRHRRAGERTLLGGERAQPRVVREARQRRRPLGRESGAAACRAGTAAYVIERGSRRPPPRRRASRTWRRGRRALGRGGLATVTRGARVRHRARASRATRDGTRPRRCARRAVVRPQQRQMVVGEPAQLERLAAADQAERRALLPAQPPRSRRSTSASGRFSVKRS